MAPTSPQSKNIPLALYMLDAKSKPSALQPPVSIRKHVAYDSGDSINATKPKVTTKKNHNGKIDPILGSNMYDTAVASKQALRVIQQQNPLTITMLPVFVVVIR